MSKERPQYIHDSAADPSPHTEAQRAFFRYQYTLGSYEYTRRHGPEDAAASIDHELTERYETYRTLRDEQAPSYTVGERTSDRPLQPGQMLREHPLQPNELPPELAEFLRGERIACVTQATDQGTAFVMKAPGAEIESVAGTIPVLVRHELHDHPQAPVIRMVTSLYDVPDTPLSFETFINVADEQQRADYAQLAEQDQLLMLFYDESLSHRLTKVVGQHQQETMAEILETAERLRTRIPAGQLDFDASKAAVMERTTL